MRFNAILASPDGQTLLGIGMGEVWTPPQEPPAVEGNEQAKTCPSTAMLERYQTVPCVRARGPSQASVLVSSFLLFGSMQIC